MWAEFLHVAVWLAGIWLAINAWLAVALTLHGLEAERGPYDRRAP